MAEPLRDLTVEVKRFFDFTQEVFDYLIKNYNSELITSKRAFTNFIFNPFEKDIEKTFASLSEFEHLTEEGHKRLKVLGNTFASRVTTFSSNFGITKLIVETEDPELRAALEQSLADVKQIKKEIVDHFSARAAEIQKLASILGEELTLMRRLTTPEAFSKHLQETRNIGYLFLKEEIPLYEQITATFAFDASRLNQSFKRIKTRAQLVAFTLSKTLRQKSAFLVGDVKSQKAISLRVALSLLFIVALSVRIYKTQSILSKNVAGKLLSRFFKRFELLDLSPEGRKLYNQLVASGEDWGEGLAQEVAGDGL